MGNKLIWGTDLYKGFKLPQNKLLGGAINDILPFQMLSLEEKTADWIRAVADYYEVAGWANVERKAGRIQKNYWMRYSKLNPTDYIVNPVSNEYYQAVGWILPPEHQSPLEQFYPLVPNFVDVLRGEFIKRDNTWTVEAIDDQSKAEVFEYREQQFKQVIMQQAILEKQQSLAEMGMGQDIDPQQYAQQMQQFMQHLTQVEMEARNFRTTGVKWAEKVLRIHEKRYNLTEIEPDAFESGLITDCEFWHLDLLDDDFKVELLNPKWCDYHKGPNIKYVSQGDYFLWFDWMSAGDIVNKFGRKMKEEDILKMKDIYVRTSNIIVPDYLKSHQGSYYDLSRPWLDATDNDPKMNDALLGKELAYNFMRTPNFEHNMEVDILNPIWGRRITGHPQMFRVMRLYWRSLRKIGWLTKIDKDGTVHQPEWIDENYKVTIEPKYDVSVVKEKTKDNLIYGEHIDWTWVPEWRHVMKISPNQKHTFWLNSANTMESIYIDGGPVKFQFKGTKNPFDSLPPVEGCQYSYLNTDSCSFVDRIKPLQILYNICMNRVPKKFLQDRGNKIAIHKALMPKNNLDNKAKTIDPLEAMEDKLDNSDIFDFSYDPEMARGFGQPPLPAVLQLSTIQEASLYFQLAQNIKWEAGELIGITRQRLGGQKASETAYSVQQGISYSETQTEKYFEQHSNLMEKVRQRMLDAAQYYSTFTETAKETYMNESDEQFVLSIEGMENLLKHYNIYLTSRANVREALQTIAGFLKDENTLDILPSAKIAALAEKSVPKLMALIRAGELEAIQREKDGRDHETMLAQQQQQAAMQQLQAQQQFTADQNERNRQTQIEVAEIRAYGGVQTDADKNGALDAAQNLQGMFKAQELQDKRDAANQELNIKKQENMDKVVAERERTQAQDRASKRDAETKKYVADKQLEAAKHKKPSSK